MAVNSYLYVYQCQYQYHQKKILFGLSQKQYFVTRTLQADYGGYGRGFVFAVVL